MRVYDSVKKKKVTVAGEHGRTVKGGDDAFTWSRVLGSGSRVWV